MWGQASPEAHKKGPDRWSSDELRHHGFALNNWFCANLIVFVSAGMISSPTPRVQGGMADTAAEFQVAQLGDTRFWRDGERGHKWQPGTAMADEAYSAPLQRSITPPAGPTQCSAYTL
jgi:hypothetical protein